MQSDKTRPSAPLKKGEKDVVRCWQCGGTLTNPFKRPVEGVERTLPLGEKVRLHKVCAVTFDQDQQDRKITARPADETFCLSLLAQRKPR